MVTATVSTATQVDRFSPVDVADDLAGLARGAWPEHAVDPCALLHPRNRGDDRIMAHQRALYF